MFSDYQTRYNMGEAVVNKSCQGVIQDVVPPSFGQNIFIYGCSEVVLQFNIIQIRIDHEHGLCDEAFKVKNRF